MSKLKKILKLTGKILLVLLVLIQFIRPDKNNSGNVTNDITKQWPMPDNVKTILATACNDCHSNTTKYPWYSQIQPVAGWLANHIDEGKHELNFNEFTSYRLYRQYHKLEEIEEVITENEMPLSSYTIIHRDAILDETQKSALINWTREIRDSMKAQYPADSLISPKKRQAQS
ncbi:MAG: heme-binding domain-containing protein [Bacteroidota bacterium]